MWNVHEPFAYMQKQAVMVELMLIRILPLSLRCGLVLPFSIRGGKKSVPQDVPQDVPQTIVALIKQNPRITREDIAKQMHLSTKTIGRYLAKLPNVKYVGSGYSGHWEIVE